MTNIHLNLSLETKTLKWVKKKGLIKISVDRLADWEKSRDINFQLLTDSKQSDSQSQYGWYAHGVHHYEQFE